MKTNARDNLQAWHAAWARYSGFEFSNKSNPGDIIGIEINPRFGGGYPFSLNAGANFPEFIIREYILNEQIEYFDKWKDNCLNIRYENEIIIND